MPGVISGTMRNTYNGLSPPECDRLRCTPRESTAKDEVGLEGRISGTAEQLKLNLRSQLHHAIRREAEECGGRAGVPGHQDEESLAPERHPADRVGDLCGRRRGAAGDERLAAEEIAGLQRLDRQRP